MDKLFSIIVPSYNMEKYLPKCLGSLIVDDAELLQRLDVIVVNDGSRDRTSEIAHDFERRYPGVFRVIDKPNGHYGSCINAALPVAKGTYVKVLDADDSFDTLTFADFLRFADMARSQHGGEIDLLVSAFCVVDENGVVTERREYDLPADKVFGIGELAKLKNDLLMHGIAYRTERVRASGYRQTEGCIYTDSEWMFEPMLTVRKGLYFKEPVYRYLVGREGQSVSAGSCSGNSHIQLSILKRLTAVCKTRKDEGLSEAFKYMVFQLARLYRLTVEGYFVWLPLRQFKDDFIPVDRELDSVAPDARLTGGAGFVLFATTRHPFHYVAAWQKRTMLPWWVLPFIVRSYMRLRAATR